MQLSFYTTIALAFSVSNAVSLTAEVDADNEPQFMQIQDVDGFGLSVESMMDLSQLLNEMADKGDHENFAETELNTGSQLMTEDLETIAEYIVHLKEDQIHKLAATVNHKAPSCASMPVVRSCPVQSVPVAVNRPAMRVVAARPAAVPVCAARPNIVMKAAPACAPAQGIKMNKNQKEIIHQSPAAGKIHTIQGGEGMDMRSRDANGVEMGINAGGVGGMGIHHAPGEASPKVCMFLNAGGNLALPTAPGCDPRGVGLRLTGDMYQDPNRNINHVDRDIQTRMLAQENAQF